MTTTTYTFTDEHRRSMARAQRARRDREIKERKAAAVAEKRRLAKVIAVVQAVADESADPALALAIEELIQRAQSGIPSAG